MSTRWTGGQAQVSGRGRICFLLGAIGSLLPPGAGLRTKGLERGGWSGSEGSVDANYGIYFVFLSF